MNYKIADISEIELILSLDEIHGTKNGRKNEIERAISDHSCYLISDQEQAVGYGIFRAYGLLTEGFIELLVIHSQYRGKGYGESFIRYCERISETNRIHTSTNSSNIPMQNLLKKLGYTEGGRLSSFDPNDPEIFFFKKIE